MALLDGDISEYSRLSYSKGKENLLSDNIGINHMESCEN